MPLSPAEQLDQARNDELLDLTLRNPLISHRMRKTRGLAVAGARPAALYDRLVAQERTLRFRPLGEAVAPEAPEEAQPMARDAVADDAAADTEPDTGSELTSDMANGYLQTRYDEDALQRRLLTTYRRAGTLLEEEGINTLYLTLGMLRWYESPTSETQREAPLLLIPVELSRTDVRGRFRLAHSGEEWAGNLSLQAYLRENFGLTWPLPPEEEVLDVQAYFDQLASLISDRPRWQVDPGGVVVDFFSFSRLLMYEDLDASKWPEDERPGDHPVLRRLLQDGFEAPEGRISDDEPLDPHLPAEDTHHVVDADSSQTRAILDVKRGLNLILQGPPGTGKSQTITNIIAEALSENKSVLFVSEKMAALEVVRRNMESVGLGPACLELHSHKTRPADVLKDLEQTLELGRPKVDGADTEIAVFEDARKQLNDYAQAVNTPVGESGVRPYGAYGELVQLSDMLGPLAPLPPLEVPGMAAWDRETYHAKAFLVEQLESHLGAMGVPAEHPFRGSAKKRYLPAERARIEAAACEAAGALADYQQAARHLAERLHLPAPLGPEDLATVRQVATLASDAPDLQGMDVTAAAWAERQAATCALLDTAARYAKLRSRYDDLLIPDAWTQDLLEVRKALATYGDAWYRWFIGAWRRATNELQGLCADELPGTAAERLEVVDAVLEAQRLRERLEGQRALGQTLFGERWRGKDANWAALVGAGKLLIDVHDHIVQGSLPEETLQALADPPPAQALRSSHEALDAAQANYREAAAEVLDLLELQPEDQAAAEVTDDEGAMDDGAEDEGAEDEGRRSDRETAEDSGRRLPTARPFEAQAAFFAACAEEAPRVQEIITLNHLSEDLRTAGLDAVLAVATTWPHGGEHLGALFRHAYLNALLERAMDERPALEDFSGGQHERVVDTFKRLDRGLLTHNRHRLALRHHEEKPRRTGAGQVGLLLHECGKQRAHMPLRRLLQRAGQAIQALKPVFMMSPLSVPKYLPPGGLTFDLVVFDEASQVRPVEAFGAVLRGRQTVVVGDSKQLPPTDFFASMGSSDANGYDMRAGDQESVLDLFRSKGAAERMLRFHYRSRHESLIAVSNREFYNDRLFIFPSPDADRGAKGLVYRHLPDTVYERGGSSTNPEEARHVAEAVMTHAREMPDLSLGVATFSTAQMDAIQEQLEVLRREDPSCESFFGGHPTEPFFVKNLETVQGDQRDVMFISVGYGRDQHGRVAMNFGPLNRDGGERRLNVLTTRAKLRCEVFTNLRAEDIDLNRTKARGVEVLKTYLDFAATGEMDLPEVTGRGPDSPFEEAVADALKAEGYRIAYQVGVAGFFIDLAVIDPEQPGRYILGIECDGASYHSSHMARVRDRSRQAVLESLGWTIHRIWSTDWFRNPDEQLARAVAAIERARLAVGESSEKAVDSPTDAAPADVPAENGAEAPGGEAAQPPEITDAEGNRSDGSAEAVATDGATDGGGGATIGRAPTVIEREAPEEPEPAVNAAPYEAARIDVQLVGADFHEVPPRKIARWLQQVVDAEGPVHREVAGRRLLDGAGISRMGRRIKRRLRRAVDAAAKESLVTVRGDFLHPTDERRVVPRDRSDAGDYVRKADHIPPEEITAAAEAIVEQTFGISREELVVEVGRLLGYGRVGRKLKRRIGATVGACIADERLVEREGMLYVAK